MKLDRSCIGNPRNKEELERLRAQLTPENHIEMNGKMYILYLEGTVPSFQDIYCPTCMSIECRNDLPPNPCTSPRGS